MFAATSVSSFRALITYYPLAIVRTFFCFWQCQSHFRHFWKYFSRRADMGLCVQQRCSSSWWLWWPGPGGGQARLVEAGPWRLMTSGPRCGVLIFPATEVLLLCLVSGPSYPQNSGCKKVLVSLSIEDPKRTCRAGAVEYIQCQLLSKFHQLGTI